MNTTDTGVGSISTFHIQLPSVRRYSKARYLSWPRKMSLTSDEIGEFEKFIPLAEILLTTKYGSEINIRPIHKFRKTTFQCELVSNQSEIPGTVIIKHPTAHFNEVYDPKDSGRETLAFKMYSELSAYLLLEQSESRIIPELIAYDTDHGILILEDVDLESMVPYLLEKSASGASRALITYAKSMSELHKSTMNKESQYLEIKSKLFAGNLPKSPTPDEIVAGAREIFKKINIEPNEDFINELLSIFEIVIDSKSPRALAHLDLCPDNILIPKSIDSAKVIDFERADYGYIFFDVMYWHLSYPTCWCANEVQKSVVAEMDAIYCEVVSDVYPHIMDDEVYYSGITRVSVISLIFGTLSFFRRKELDSNLDFEDTRWGIATIKPRILSRTNVVIKPLKKNSKYPAILNVLNEVYKRYSQLWHNIEHLPHYPSFNK